ncbi:type III pantothenate kinase [Curvivirga sp.]|uniref:type III pantothenate kinase n=1 Tax=Curvivirga sp. TaxID=2856848 RepID=UPI003B58C6CD
MLLAIDSGNTNVVFAVYDGDERLGVWRCMNDPKRTADEYAVWLHQLMAIKDIEFKDITRTILASVVPETMFNLESLCRRYFDDDPLLVSAVSGIKLGIEVLIKYPRQVGADRIVNAIAGHKKYGGPLIIVDFGTATTFDIVDGNGNYCGGVIAPGPNLSLKSLYMAAAQLPLVEIKASEKVIGDDTESAMQSGIFWGYVAMLEGMIDRIVKEFGEDMKVIATGGLSDIFAQSTDKIQDIDRGLTLDGLVEIYKRNI